MSPNVHALFPVGDAGGAHRSIPEAARRTMRDGVRVTLGHRVCPACHRSTVWLKCGCGAHTEPTPETVTEPLPIARIWADAVGRLHLGKAPEVKGVKGLTSPGKVPETLEKGILRAAHGISVYQDGTARFDLTDLPLTHFRPREIGLPPARARALGYATDWAGEPLADPEQLVELRPQDIVIARAGGEYLLKLAQFVDAELVKLYGLEPFYGAARPEDLIGHIVVALAPHTSGGVAGRIIGFTDAEACFAHPVFHAAKRRNCDGDEDSVTLLMDTLLNFSRSYLPESRGALMDKPLVLTTRLDPTEVDKEAHNLDVAARYPIEFYRLAQAGRPAKEAEPLIETLGSRLKLPEPMAGLAFTHDTSDIAGGPVCSAYREAGSMARGVELSLAPDRPDPGGRRRRRRSARPQPPLPPRSDGEPEELRDAEVPLQDLQHLLPTAAALGAVLGADGERRDVPRRDRADRLRGGGPEVPRSLAAPRRDRRGDPVPPSADPDPGNVARDDVPGGAVADHARRLPERRRGGIRRERVSVPRFPTAKYVGRARRAAGL